MQQFGNPDQKIQIYALFAQNLIHIRPGGMYRLGKPRHRPALCLQLGSDHVSYV